MIQENKDFLLLSTAGDSMFPFIRRNEEILVAKAPPEDIAIGDVILFKSENGDKVCHRIIKIENKDGALWFRAKGDRNKSSGELISQRDVLGKVIAVKRRMGLMGLRAGGRRSFLWKCDSFLARSMSSVKKILKNIISL